MQDPFCSVPLIWIIQEDTLANRLTLYEEMGQKQLVAHWKSTFSRANVIVFPDFTLPVYLLSCLNCVAFYHSDIFALSEFPLFLVVSDVI